MNRRNWVIAAVLAGLSCGLGSAEEPASPNLGRVANFEGQIVAITLMSDSEDLVLLSEVSQKQIGEKTFLSGVGVDDGETPDWRNGAVVFVPIDDVQQIVAFSNLKAYKKNLDARESRVEGKAASSRVRRGPRT
jgi:hypothetical protein